MKNIFLLLLFILSVTVQAQDSTHITKAYRNGMPDEDYYINAAGNKNGKYTKYTRNGNIYVNGQYNNGKPVGSWNFYAADTSGVLVQTLNFETRKETIYDSIRVAPLVCGPRYFGGNMLKQEYVQLRIQTDFTPEERAEMKGKNVMAVFEVDSATYTTYGITVDDPSVSPEVRAKMVKIIKEMPAWLPPVCKTGTRVWRMSVIFVFQ